MRPNRQTEIIKTATTLARAQGLGAVTYESISSAMGVTKAGVVYHFPQRRDLLRAMVGHTTQEVRTQVEHLHDQTGTPRMTAYISLLLDGTLGAESPALTTEIAADDELAHEWRELLESWTSELVELGADRGDVLTARLAASAGAWMLSPDQVPYLRSTVDRLLNARDGEATR